MRTRELSLAHELLGDGDVDAVALHTDHGPISRRELAERVTDRRAELGLPHRSVVIVHGAPTLDWVVSYLALLADEHVPLLAGDHLDRLVTAWDPAAIVEAHGDGVHVERRAASARSTDGPRALHPDLALLLSTSGSTGDPKLVRLSRDNIVSNARAIREYLQLGPADCGITTLPLHYCYGLSVLHSHLIAGASVVLSSASVVDPCFAAALRTHRVTNVAGVPHTFELLEGVGPDRLEVPSLRLLTQAGGKMPPADVVRWRERSAAWGVDFYVMYGQTEATARMAYLPPELAERHPEAIGVAIPGGRFRLEQVDRDERPQPGGDRHDDPRDDRHDGQRDDPHDDQCDVVDGEVGELVYDGPNVMLGYAVEPADLALGRCVDELRTGDLARFHRDDGVYEIVGRRSRLIKPFGLRIDLDALERDLAAEFASEIVVAGDDDGVAVLASPTIDRAAVHASLVARTGLPRARIAVATVEEFPRTASGKLDTAAATRLARGASQPIESPPSAPDGAARVFAAVLGRPSIDPADTFVSLGGDSLSYIECSIRLESILGPLPPDWHLRPVRELTPRRRARFVAPIDTTVLLRVVAIFAVVATHMHLRFVPGGAHLLLAVVGYNLSRFLLPIDDTRDRVMAGLRTAARIAVPTMLWVAIGLAAGATYGAGTLFLVNNYVGPASHGGDHWHFWFIEVFVHVILIVTALMAVPAIRRTDRRFPYLLPLVVLGALSLLRMEWAQMGDWYNLRFRTHGVAWFVALGWLVHRSDTMVKRVATAGAIVLVVPGFFEYVPRERFIAICLLVLLVFRQLPVPRLAVRPLAAVASASMWIYISHFAIWPPLVDLMGVRAAYLPTILGGVAVWAIAERAVQTGRRAWFGRDVADRAPVVRIP